MKNKSAKKTAKTRPNFEVEFVDMNHTLTWLLETAEHYRCKDAIFHLQEAQKLINQRRLSLFVQEDCD